MRVDHFLVALLICPRAFVQSLVNTFRIAGHVATTPARVLTVRQCTDSASCLQRAALLAARKRNRTCLNCIYMQLYRSRL